MTSTKDVDVVIVGGGITGAMTALRLAQAGVRAVVVDQADLGSGASGANAGSMHGQIQFPPFRDEGEQWARRWAPTLELLAASVEIWRGLGAELGVDFEVKLSGGLLVADAQDQIDLIERKVALENEWGVASRMLSRAELRKLAPYLADDLIGGELCPIEGKANPLVATPAIARAAEDAGAQILRGVEVTGLDHVDGRFVVRSADVTVRAERLVLCAGADTARLGRMLGVELPIESHPMQVAVTEIVEPLVPHLVYYAGGALTLKQAGVGSILIGGGWPAAVDPVTGQASVDVEGLRRNLAVARRVVPAIGRARVLRTWVGRNNGVPDQMPILGPLDEIAPGLVVGTFPYLGFSGGPVMGEILADLARGRTPRFDLTPYAPLRAV